MFKRTDKLRIVYYVDCGKGAHSWSDVMSVSLADNTIQNAFINYGAGTSEDRSISIPGIGTARHNNSGLTITTTKDCTATIYRSYDSDFNDYNSDYTVTTYSFTANVSANILNRVSGFQFVTVVFGAS